MEQPNRPLLKDIMVEYKEFYGKDKYEIEGCWEEIGIQLKVDDYSLRSIISDNAETEYRTARNNFAFRDMITRWLKQENPPPTWSSFVEALERVKLLKFAHHLRSKYGMHTCFVGSSVYSIVQHGDDELTDDDFPHIMAFVGLYFSFIIAC